MQTALIICMNYHAENDTESFVSELLTLENSQTLKVIVVNNNEGRSENQTLLNLAEHDSRVVVMSPGKNLGYFGGARLALRNFLENSSLPEWVIISNTDISFPQRDFFTKLFSLYRNDAPQVLALAVLCGSPPLDQNPHLLQRPGRARMHFVKWMCRHYSTYVLFQSVFLIRQKLNMLIFKLLKYSERKGKSQSSKPRLIYAPHGSFILFHKSYFERGGDLNHGAFLFGEEFYVAETARRQGMSVMYDPRLVVLHQEHRTTGIFLNKRIARYMRQASSYCVREFFS